MNRSPLVLALAFGLVSTPALAQHEGHSMQGMTMPMPPPARKPAAKPPAATAKKATPKKTSATAAKPAARPAAKPAAPMAGMPGMDHGSMPGMGTAASKPPAAPKSATRPGASKRPTPSTRPTARKAPAKPGKPTPAMDMSGMDHSGMEMGIPPSPAPAADMSGMDHSKMEMPAGAAADAMPGMDHSTMAMPGMGTADLPAGAPPRTPVAAPTDADRAAAFPAVAGHAVHDKRPQSYWLMDRFEMRDTAGDGSWEGLGWVGGDINRLWLRTEGEVEGRRIGRGDVEVLYGRSISPWWDVVTGVRQDFGQGPARTWAAIGLQGLAPYKFEVQATAYVGQGGRTAARLGAEYETLLTNRLILQWRGETNLYGRSDPRIGIGSGLSTVEAGARLRYEINRRFAPHVGVEVERAFGKTADLRRAEGLGPTDTRLVAGLRFWF